MFAIVISNRYSAALKLIHFFLPPKCATDFRPVLPDSANDDGSESQRDPGEDVDADDGSPEHLRICFIQLIERMAESVHRTESIKISGLLESKFPLGPCDQAGKNQREKSDEAKGADLGLAIVLAIGRHEHSHAQGED